MKKAEGYILRIATNEWVEQVFDLAIYYTGFRRKWRSGQTIMFVHKTDVGDAVVGYGVIENVYETNELSEEESAPEGTIPINASLDLAVYTQSATIE